MNALDPCRHCGDTRAAHQHYRRGTDCAVCDCPRFGRQWTLRNLRHVTVTRSAAGQFLAAVAILLMAAALAVASLICSGQAWAVPPGPNMCVAGAGPFARFRDCDLWGDHSFYHEVYGGYIGYGGTEGRVCDSPPGNPLPPATDNDPTTMCPGW